MTPETVIVIGREALELLILLTAAVLLPALAVGLVIAIFQAATQINEQTMTFVPKLLVTFLMLMFLGPWIIKMMVAYVTQLYGNIPLVIG